MTVSLRQHLYFVVVLGLCAVTVACELMATDSEERIHEAEADTSSLCLPVGTWVDPNTRTRVDPIRVFASFADKSVVLLGESHPSAEDHRWQLHTLASLYGRNPNMVIGFEMFPRSKQAVLDSWVEGELNDQNFLEEVAWDEIWGYDAHLYLPLFHFARQNRIPMIAINVKRELVERVGDVGWSNIPEEDREGVSHPAPPSDTYLRDLAVVFLIKKSGDFKEHTGFGDFEWDEEQIEEVLKDPDFQRFSEAQATWDRAMAEGLVTGMRRHGATLGVGIMGSGHVEHGHGVAHQLKDLGVVGVGTSLTTSAAHDCRDIHPGVADLVFVVPDVAPSKPAYPLLGVHVKSSEQGVRIESVVENSVAQAAGLEEGDIITSAAGSEVHTSGELVKIIRRQAPGTWLPLEVVRNGKHIAIVAKFPPRSTPTDSDAEKLSS